MVLKKDPSRLRSWCSDFSSAALGARLALVDEGVFVVVVSSSPILQVVSLTWSSFIMMAPYDTL